MASAPLVIAGVAVLGVAAYLVYNQHPQVEVEQTSSERTFRKGSTVCASDYNVTFDGETYCLVKTEDNLER